MIRIIRHITATLLLVILPISAIGLNITINKCHHRGTFHISLSDSSKNHLKNDCCSCCNNMNLASNQMSADCQRDHKTVHTGCSMVNMSEKKKMNSGIQTTKDLSKNSSNQTKDSKIFEIGTHDLNASCCSNFEFSNDISIHLCTIKITKDNFVVPLITYDNFQATNFDLLIKEKKAVKDRQYPLKGPIDYIISFIHSTSQSVDEAEPISSLLSYIA